MPTLSYPSRLLQTDTQPQQVLNDFLIMLKNFTQSESFTSFGSNNNSETENDLKFFNFKRQFIFHHNCHRSS